jgi:PAS domain S-box-containing protein
MENNSKQITPPYIVGISASAGGLEALTSMVKNMPKNSKICFLLIQHIEKNYARLMPETLRKKIGLNVQVATNNLVPKSNTLYILPSNKNITLKKGKIQIQDWEHSRSPNLPINTFFNSLAINQKDRAIGVILSGTGADGTIGISNIKKHNGLVIVQNPKTATFTGMIQSAIATGLVDLIADPYDIYEHINQYIENTNSIYRPDKESENTKHNEILTLINQNQNRSYLHYKKETIQRRLKRRMDILNISDNNQYLSYLKESTEEIKNLSDELSIGSTGFFRDSKAFQELKKEILIPLVKNAEEGRELRIWIAACSTGEEVYSLAMILHDELTKLKKSIIIKIFGTDIDERAIKKAKDAIYSKSDVQIIPKKWLTRYFTESKNNYVVNDRLSEMIIFSKHNLITDPPFSKIDLVSCRNILLYMKPISQERILSYLHYSLKIGGSLFLGLTEFPSSYSNSFSTVSDLHKIYIKNKNKKISQTQLILIEREKQTQNDQQKTSLQKNTPINNSKYHILKESITPTIIINKKNQIIHTEGEINQHLKLYKKHPFYDLFDIVSDELFLVLSTIISKLKTNKTKIISDQIMFSNKTKLPIHIIGQSFNDPVSNELFFVLNFVTPKSDIKEMETSKSGSKTEQALYAKIKRLELELRDSRDFLDSTVEQLENTNEELHTTNEELMSANEGLQSSQDELQSINKELSILNYESQDKLDKASHINDDLNNFIECTNVATLFLNRDYTINRFTESVLDLIKITKNYIGITISSFKNEFLNFELKRVAQKVLDTGQLFQYEVKVTDNKTFLIKGTPYLTKENKIEGVVFSMLDITTQKETQYKLESQANKLKTLNTEIIERELRFKALVQEGADLIGILDEDGTYKYVSPTSSSILVVASDKLIGRSLLEFIHPDDAEKTLACLQKMSTESRIKLAPYRIQDDSKEFRWIETVLTNMMENPAVKGIVVNSRDVTEQMVKAQEKDLLTQISAVFNAEKKLSNAALALVKVISKFGKFDWVEIWTTNIVTNQRQLLSHFVISPEDEVFYDYQNEDGNYNTVGKVWEYETEFLCENVENNKDFTRNKSAKKIGLKAVLGIPLKFNNEVVCVLNIGTKQSGNYLNNFTKIFKRLETFIGSELNRKKLENDLSHLFDSIPDMICVIDFQGKVLKINKFGCDLIGYRERDIIGQNLDVFTHPKEKGVFNSELKLHKEKGAILKFESRYITKSEEVICLSWYCSIDINEGLIYATAKNITEEKQLRQLSLQAGKLAQIGSWEMNMKSQTLYWSDTVHQLHDTDPKLYKPNLEDAIDFYRVDFRELVKSNIEGITLDGESSDFEAVIITKKKKERWVRVIGSAEFLDGECIRVFGSIQGIHERKDAEQKLQSLADNIPGVVFQYLLHPNGTNSFKYVTKGSIDIWGVVPEEVVTNSQIVWDGVFDEAEEANVKKSITDSIQNKSKWTCRWKYRMPTGEIRFHMGYGSPNFLADGTVLFNSVILDITQESTNEVLLEKYTHELERSNEELEQFAYVASHDLQEPLRMVSSFLDLLQRKYGDLLDEKGLQYIYLAADGSKRMKQIILDLLEYSRVGKLIEGKENVDLNEILSEYKTLRRNLILENSASIHFKELPTLHTYRTGVVQIFHCLLDNALKYINEDIPPVVEIKAVENDTEWTFSVTDNGIGIDPQFYEKIFVIFQRLHNRDQYAGTGIGLSIAKKQVEFFGGLIWLEPNPQEGTIFHFTIPKINQYVQ